MRVLHLDEQTGWRGGEQQASWLMQGLAAQGHEVWLAARPGSAIMEHEHGGALIRRVPLSLRGEFDLASAWKIARLASMNGIPILHAHTSQTHSIALLSQLFFPDSKVVVHRRVSFPPKPGLLNRWKYHAPDRIVCVSARVREVLADAGLPEYKLALVHSAVDFHRLDVPPADREALGVPEGALLLFSAGALVGHKDHATLLEAFALAQRECPSCMLLIAGEGELRTELEKRVKTLGLQEHVRLLGHRDDVPAITRAADCYISSSWSEGLGTSVLEALGSGTPVVATEAGGVGEMVLDGKTGRLVPNRNPDALAAAIIHCLNHPAETATMAEAGQAWVQERFGVEKMVAGNLKVYEALLGSLQERQSLY